ncbi:hypothetical protein JWV37_06055 [Sulfurospirillum sp. T05]|uniref:Uncharacterized protein n=1 Tax=Sulfurospirillum tamanense TaxID=2813362 RepID=A0ABS2WS51_9BACT|nr:hypothetical protein [Sulfurospirillum tamanensis]MBN2964335.1 hypothetical protein [Sulfurospirillum tamanensis]
MTIDNLQNYIDEIAIEAFNKYRIIRNEAVFELAEIEIYLKDAKKGIDDIYRHDRNEHLESLKEYQHYSGFDICNGNKDKDIYCGILVRGLMNESEAIYGPRRVKYGGREKSPIKIEIITNESSENRFQFYSSEINSNVIFKLPRVNLSNKISQKYFCEPQKLQKYLNLKARYLRIKDENFSSNKYLAESREIWNAILKKLNS